MKIAYFAGAWPVTHAQSGIVTYVDIMTRALREAGHECVVITRNLMEDDGEPAVYVADDPATSARRTLTGRIQRRIDSVFQRGSRRYALAIARALERASQRGPVDILEIEESFGYPYYIQQRVSTPVAVRLHGPHFLVSQDGDSRSRRSRIDAEGKAIGAAAALSCPTRAVLDKVQTFYGSAGAVNAVIPNPVAMPSHDRCWRLEDCDRDMILFVGRFDLVKGADIMLDAFARLAARRKSLRLVMTGRDVGVPDDSGALLKYADYARARLSNDIRDRVSFLGRVDPEGLSILRRQALVCVSASRFEMFPYAVNEAAAMGCPVVSTATPGPVELFVHGESILLAAVGDAEAIADRIGMLIENPARASELGRAGRRTVEVRLSPETVAAQMLAFYGRAIAGRQGSAHEGRQRALDAEGAGEARL